jgi:HSP20 family molecular chaperone IbpA
MHTQNEQTQTDTQRFLTPPVDIYEKDDAIFVIADLPGVNKDDLDIKWHEGQLTFEATRQGWDEEQNLSTEFRPHGFRRTFKVNEKVDIDNITAEIKEGVLTIQLPKSPDLKPRQISIN